MNWTQKKQKAPKSTFKNDNFQIQVKNGQLKEPFASATLKFDIAGKTFAANFVVVRKLIGPVTWLHFVRNNSVVLDTTHGLIQVPHLMKQVKRTSEMGAKPQVVLTDDVLTMPPNTTKTITAFVDHPSEWNTTVTATPLEKFTEAASLLISKSRSTITKRN